MIAAEARRLEPARQLRRLSLRIEVEEVVFDSGFTVTDRDQVDRLAGGRAFHAEADYAVDQDGRLGAGEGDQHTFDGLDLEADALP